VKKLLISLLLLSMLGFSQDCENSILDEVLQNDNINQYFQIALTINTASLDFLNNCDQDISYTMFVPGSDVPTSSAATLLSLDGELIDYINYYITYNDNIYQELLSQSDLTQGVWASSILVDMIDGNQSGIIAQINQYDTEDIMSWTINDINISTSANTPICACNGSIYIIDDLIWAPGVLDLEESYNQVVYHNSYQKLLNVSKITEKGVLKIVDMRGTVLLSKEVNNNTQINTSTYRSGVYFINFKSQNQNFTESFLIN